VRGELKERRGTRKKEESSRKGKEKGKRKEVLCTETKREGRKGKEKEEGKRRRRRGREKEEVLGGESEDDAESRIVSKRNHGLLEIELILEFLGERRHCHQLREGKRR